jgi:hypothetical protein
MLPMNFLKKRSLFFHVTDTPESSGSSIKVTAVTDTPQRVARGYGARGRPGAGLIEWGWKCETQKSVREADGIGGARLRDT